MSFPVQVRCAIFDLDGTLLNSLDDLADSANAVLRAKGWPEHDSAEYRFFVGDGARTLVQRVLPEAVRNDAGVVRECLERYVVEYGTRWDRKTKPYDGISELLRQLAARGIDLAVLSNKPHAFTLQCVHKLCPAPQGSEWAVILGQRDGAVPKPDPAGVHEILARLGAAPGETIYFGDTATDMRTAVAAGVYPIGVLWGFRSREELERSGAALLLRHPCEVLPYLPQ